MSAPSTMPFGKHKGKRFEDIPLSYLQWCLKNLDEMGEDLHFAITLELGFREAKANKAAGGGRSYTAPPSNLPVAVSADIAVEIIKEGRRVLALRYHPDRNGGNGERMTQTNATADYLEQRISTVLGGGVRL